MGGACGTYGREEIGYRFLIERPERRDHLEDLGVNGRIALKLILNK